MRREKRWLPGLGLLSEGLGPVVALLLLGGEALLGGGLLLLLLDEVPLLVLEGGLGLAEVGLGGGEGPAEAGVGVLEVGDELLEGLAGVALGGGVLLEGGLERVSELGHLLDDRAELALVDAGGNLHEGRDGVGFTDLRELDEDLGVRLGADGGELGEDHVERFDGLLGVSDSGGVGGFVSLAVLLDELEVVVDDNHLVLEGGDHGLEVGDLATEGRDSLDGLTDVGGRGVDSSLEFLDGLGALGLSLSLELRGGLLLGDEVAVDAREQSGDVGEGGLVGHLDGDGVEELTAELGVLNLGG